MNAALLSSKKMDYCTPQAFFDALNREFSYIYGKAEIRFVRGRLRFTDEEGNAYAPAPFPSMVVIYNGRKEKDK